MPPAIPIATHRLQLSADFDFDAAASVVPYLKALGITHLYASPFMRARKGSTHGYDVTDHAAFNPELGGEAGFERLSAVLRRHDLGLILDFVPNHVGVHYDDNPWWLDVLEWGPASPHAASFDIDWDQLPYRARGGVLLPIIGSSYGEALERGEIELRYDADEGSFSAWYFEHRLPIAPERYGEILRVIVRESGAEAGEAGKRTLELAARYKGLRHPNREEAHQFKAALRAIAGSSEVIARGLSAYRAGPDRFASTLALHPLLERQHYRLGHWRLASSDINYRRFFDINTLAGLRVEDAGTFAAIHRMVKRLIEEGKLQGLRLDHIDGLRDPAQYFVRLRRLIRDAPGEDAGPVYRTYLTSAGPSAHDRALISETIERARANWFAADDGIFDFLRDTLTMDLIKPGRPHHGKPRVRRFALKVQQFTGPLMAKSLEDTAFYRYHRLLALNEVGGDPEAKAISADAFHGMMRTRAREWPHGMTATATHDTKRGEDARARIMALAKIPGEWSAAVARWKLLNTPHLTLDGELRAPSATFEYMLYQALLGAWQPDDDTFTERMQAFALKAAREGKQETSWLNPHAAYEAGLKRFIERILDRAASPEFLDSLQALARRVSLLGALNSLSQITLKATMPGVPDFYQGTEFWDFSFVDPDNRRPVDFAARASVLK